MVEFDVPARDPGSAASSRENAAATFDQLAPAVLIKHILGEDNWHICWGTEAPSGSTVVPFAMVRVLRFAPPQLADQQTGFSQAATCNKGRVKLAWNPYSIEIDQ